MRQPSVLQRTKKLLKVVALHRSFTNLKSKNVLTTSRTMMPNVLLHLQHVKLRNKRSSTYLRLRLLPSVPSHRQKTCVTGERTCRKVASPKKSTTKLSPKQPNPLSARN